MAVSKKIVLHFPKRMVDRAIVSKLVKDYGLDLFRGFPEYIFGVLIYMGIACLLGMVLAIIGAAGPAYRAAQLQPVDAMRVEI